MSETHVVKGKKKYSLDETKEAHYRQQKIGIRKGGRKKDKKNL